ncbi:unnamed protein product [Caretta caretta]
MVLQPTCALLRLLIRCDKVDSGLGIVLLVQDLLDSETRRSNPVRQQHLSRKCCIYRNDIIQMEVWCAGGVYLNHHNYDGQTSPCGCMCQLPRDERWSMSCQRMVQTQNSGTSLRTYKIFASTKLGSQALTQLD